MYDYSRAVSKARCFRELIGLSDNQPVTEFHMENVISVLKCLGIKVFTYDQLATINNGNINELISIWGPDGAAVIKDNNKFIVLNNSEPYFFFERKIWTLLHEIGHFFLGHLMEKDCIRLRSDKYDWFESETNVFVANILMPENVIRDYVKQHFHGSLYIDINQLACMRGYLNVSWTALTNRLDYLGIQPTVFSSFLFNTYKERKKIASNKTLHINSRDMQRHTMEKWSDYIFIIGDDDEWDVPEEDEMKDLSDGWRAKNYTKHDTLLA